MSDFVHLHIHSEFSLLDGANRIKDLPVRAKELGMKAMAITDHGVMYGVIDFYKACKKEGIKPIIGAEVYVASRTRFDKEPQDKRYYHLILLAKNNKGYQNLSKLVSLGFTEGYYYKPRIDLEILEKYHEGIICLSACLAGAVSQAILNGNIEEAEEVAKWHKNVFGEDYYLEIQNNGVKEQVMVNQKIIQIARRLDIPIVATNDAHYLKKEDAYNHEVLLCIQTGKRITDEDRMRFETDELYVKSPEEMSEYFKNFPDAIENTVKIAEKCNVEFEFGHTILPNYDVPEEFNTHYDYFKKLCYDGIKVRYGDNPSQEILDRAEYELKIISQMGYVDYYLIVWDYINYAKSVGIPVGPGRGSGAGSILAYAIGITDIDPMKYSLLFERFLNPERISMPDFDVDFCYERRGEVIDYVEKKYGKDHVSQIITFGTMSARMVIRDVGRALDMPYAECDKLAKMIPNELHITIDKALEQNKELRDLYEQDEDIGKMLDIARALEGMPRQASTHACGVVITKEIIQIARRLDIPIVATNDAHYLKKEDAYNHEVLLCIQTGKRITDEDRMRFETDELYVKSPEEMSEYFKNFPDAIENTVKIAEKCNVEFEFGHTILPNYDVPEEFNTHYDYFKKLCYDGIKVRYGDNPSQEILDRAEYELKIISQMGYVDYYLIVWDYINYAKSVGIPVGPGRGSGAGSILAYAIGITDIDPMKYSLLFERFLNPERISMPDFDVDFCYERRGEVIDYVEKKYGKDHVSQIITFGTMSARMVIRDVGRALDMPYAECDKLAKMIPNELHITIDKALEQNKELRDLYEQDEDIGKMLDIARALEGMPRQASTHACGVVITKEPVDTYVPLYVRDGQISTQFIMTTLEELGLLKMDFLGLRTLTVIQDAINLVKENRGIDVEFDKDMGDANVYKLWQNGESVGIFQFESQGMTNFMKELKPDCLEDIIAGVEFDKDMGDANVYKLWQNGESVGIFQFESQGMTNFMKELKPDCLEDIIAGVSLYRPGPMDQIPRYIKNKKNPENAEYTHPSLIPILNVTYGCMVYQEQVMQIVRDLAGYSLGRADLVRRAMGKKKLDVSRIFFR